MGKEVGNQLEREIDVLYASVDSGRAIIGTWKGLVLNRVTTEVIAFEPL